MREDIGKYRGKRIDNGEWAKGQRLYDEITGKAWIVLSITESQQTEGGLYVYCVEVDPETVGEYTGLPDKNGKEIFEGDIAEVTSCMDEVYMAEVMFNHMEWELCDVDGGISIHDQIIECKKMVEIIGNIHDNPELLK
jgi:uncharacterized phage protein (TIGR01671 family)